MPTVSAGLYYGFDADEIAAEKARYVAAVKQATLNAQAAGGGGVAGGTIAGDTVTYTAVGQMTFDQWRAELRNAEADLAGDPPAAQNAYRFVAR